MSPGYMLHCAADACLSRARRLEALAAACRRAGERMDAAPAGVVDLEGERLWRESFYEFNPEYRPAGHVEVPL